MKKMKKILILVCVLLVAFSCKKQDGEINDGNLDQADITVSPTFILTFDHTPTQSELYNAGLKHIAVYAKDQEVTSLSYPDANYEKLVILGVKTANVTNAGTDDASHCRFLARYINNLNLYKTVAYVLDKPNRDDLNKDAYNAFYYFITDESNVSDQFVAGLLSNTASDGWLCQYVSYQDLSCSGSRSVTLTWGNTSLDWVQSDGNVISIREISTNLNTWLYYQNCSQ